MARQRQITASVLTSALLSSAIVYAQYHPSDSVAVERGDALWFAMLALILMAVGAITNLLGLNSEPQQSVTRTSRLSLLLDVIPWLMAAWMVVGAFATCPPGNLRLATNEAWLWISGAAVFVTARRVLVDGQIRRAITGILLAVAVAQSIHALHQQYVSLPQTRRMYEADPDSVLAMTGLNAPEGSSERVVFENRLRDGGPTGTFALANSVAAVLLLGVVLSLGILRFCWPEMANSERGLWGLACIVLLVALWATHSRSALIAAVLGGLALVFIPLGASSAVSQTRYRRLIGIALGGSLVVFILGVSLVLAFGDPELIEAAPASLSFRIQYWRTTITMVAEHPWFGAGPGNFQSIYERFREPTAIEQIAEPHNFFFETLGSGGLIAGSLLLIFMFAFVWFLAGRAQDLEIQIDERDQDGNQKWGTYAVWLGAIVTMMLVWLIGLLMLRIPDLDAQLIAIPVAVGVTVLAHQSMAGITDRQLDRIGSVVLAALMLHLSIAGGWTVPGVATLIWIVAAMVSRIQVEPIPRLNHSISKRTRSIVVVGLSSVLVVCLVVFSLLPVSRERAMLEKVGELSGRGSISAANQLLEQAAQADLWSGDAPRWRADAYRWQLVSGREKNDRLHEKWRESVQVAKRRSGDDPAAFRELGTSQLHLYQRFGERQDLLDALMTFSDAVAMSPSDQWIAAQTAEIAKNAGRSELADQMTERARWLSNLGGTWERTLEFQVILPAMHFGPRVAQKPVMQKASDLLVTP